MRPDDPPLAFDAPSAPSSADRLGRALQDLRISVTDRCDFRCTYCMPEDHYVWIERQQILRFEEITRLARLFVERGVRKIRITGGEPLLRAHLPRLVEQLAALRPRPELCLTTNGSQLAEQAAALRAAGIDRLNVSLDTLRPERFAAMTRRDALPRVLEGLEAAAAAGFASIKLNMVVERGINEDEIPSLAAFCRERGHRLRLIEFMDVGTRNEWSLAKVVPADEMTAIVARHFPLGPEHREKRSDPASVHAWADGAPGDFGTIASITRAFCGDCTRARLTADGKLVTCLFASAGTDLKTPLRQGESDSALGRRIDQVWRDREDRYSERRAELRREDDGPPRDALEMITLGG